MNKLVVLGMDGATWNVLTPLIEQNKLPNLKKLRGKSAWADLDSTVPPLTPPAWTSAFTGKNPGKHNVFDFAKSSREDYELHLTSRLDRKTRAVWNAVSEAGGKVVLMNVAHTFPPEKVNGVVISGFGTPESECDYTYPPELKQEILKKHPDFKPGIPTSFIANNDTAEFLKVLDSHTKTNFQVFKELYKENTPELGIYVFDEMDRLMHFFWHCFDEKHPRYEKTDFTEKFINHFQLVDKLIGEFLEKLPDDVHVMSFSDHGFGPVHSDIYLNNYLLEKGYITLKEGAKAEIKVTTSVKIKSVIVKFLEKIGLWKFYRDYRLKTIPVGTVWFLKNIDWTKTKAVMASMAGKSIRLNVCNRDPIGAVNSDEVVSVIESLKKDLLDLCDPDTGEKVITKIWRGTEAYSGEYAIYAPDVILETASGYSFHHGFSDSIIKESTQHGRIRSGDHEQFGTFILSGEGIKSGKLDEAGIMDIAPTILHIMGLPVSDEMDGKFLEEAFEEKWKEKHPLKIIEEIEWSAEISSTSDDEEKQIAEQLKALGYL
ncbi:MAG: hypothetical protein DRI44_06470 [Chlamydiae bacterium]|nr:MAG: hypothetical protein DRI44_06470 [Chlamydiota bacterium]